MKRVSDIPMYMMLDIEGLVMTVISAYAPQVGCLREEKDKLWTDMDALVESGGKHTQGRESGDRGRFQWTCCRRKQRR